MTESMENKMSRVLREVFVRAFRDGSERERQGEVTRARFNAACAKALDFRNTPSNTNIYWAMAQEFGYIAFPKPDTLNEELQTFTRATVRADIWANDGFILAPGEMIQDAIQKTSKRGRKRGTIEVLDLRGMRAGSMEAMH